MAKIKANERVFQGQVISWIKKQIDTGSLPFQNAINDPGLYGMKTVRFPDVLLTLDKECRNSFCGWELKTPETDVRDKDLLRDAYEKAKAIGAKYCVTWNMQSAIIWQIPSNIKAFITENDKKQEYSSLQIFSVDDLHNENKYEQLEKLCSLLLRDLANLYKNEAVDLPIADATVFVGLVAEISNRLASTLKIDVEKAASDKSFDRRLDVWAKKQGVNKYDQEYRQTLAEQITYRLVGKILFYISLRRNRPDLPKMVFEKTNHKVAQRKLRGLFQQALEIDYQAIFDQEITDEVEYSRATVDILIELTEKLEHWSFELMPYDVIGAVFERLIPQEARHTLGQYFTPDNLVDLIVSFCIKHPDDFTMDPTCGTGGFLIRSYQRLKHLRRKAHHELLNQIWGFDIAGFPAELATINLCRQDFSNYVNFPRVLAKDFFDVMPGDEFEFPPPKKTVKSGERIKIKIPEFNALVGNFPFIRQELIEKVENGYKNRIAKTILDSWQGKYTGIVDDDGALKLSGQADIYAYMYFHAAAHLKTGGRMGFITSNSWLDVAYGYELQRFFLSKFKLVAICESRCEPWFEQSAVNTVFAILERCDDDKERMSNPVRFVKLKKPLAELFKGDPLLDAQKRWNDYDRFVDRIEDIDLSPKGRGKKHFEKVDGEHIRQPEIISYEDDDIRVRVIRQVDLLNELEHSGQTCKWGQYLKAPDVYFEILNKCGRNISPLTKKADVEYGIKTGINEFFFLTKDQIAHWGIEKEYIRPIVTSTKEIPNIRIDKGKLRNYLFHCMKDKNQIKGTKALEYIKNGERKKTSDGILFPEVPSVKGRKNWYTSPINEVSDFLVLQFRDRRHYTPLNSDNYAVGNVVFVGKFKDKEYAQFGAAFLNSILIALFAEISGRTNLGDGLLTTYGPEIESLPVPKNFSEKNRKKILIAFEKLLKREVLDIDQEVKRKDRADFEKALFEVLGLDADIYDEVCKAVVELVEERHLIPKLRTIRKKKRTERNVGELKKQIEERVLPSGPQRFPENFVSGLGKMDCEEYSVSAGLLKLGDNFMGKQQICDESGKQLFDVGDAIKGKFIVYAKKKDELIVRIPNRMVVVKKAIQDYEHYLRDLKKELISTFIDHCGDRILAENLTKAVFDDYGLPEV
jgi:type I restriction-modification system DNA methylase subunit